MLFPTFDFEARIFRATCVAKKVSQLCRDFPGTAGFESSISNVVETNQHTPPGSTHQTTEESNI